jgi:hypothetical protein
MRRAGMATPWLPLPILRKLPSHQLQHYPFCFRNLPRQEQEKKIRSLSAAKNPLPLQIFFLVMQTHGIRRKLLPLLE